MGRAKISGDAAAKVVKHFLEVLLIARKVFESVARPWNTATVAQVDGGEASLRRIYRADRRFPDRTANHSQFRFISRDENV